MLPNLTIEASPDEACTITRRPRDEHMLQATVQDQSTLRPPRVRAQPEQLDTTSSDGSARAGTPTKHARPAEPNQEGRIDGSEVPNPPIALHAPDRLPPGPPTSPDTTPERTDEAEPDGAHTRPAGNAHRPSPSPGESIPDTPPTGSATDESGASEATRTDPDGAAPHGTAPHATDTTADNWSHVRAAQEGDNSAFGLLYAEYSHMVYRYVLLRVSDHSLAEDITSETFTRALRRIASVSYQGRDVAAWFITIAKNLVLDHIKSGRYRLETPIADPVEAGRGNRTGQSCPEQHVLAEAAHKELLDSVRKLNPDQRECIRLRFLQGLSVTETAQLMGRNEGAVKALQHRAIRRLAQLLPEDLY